jgi:hypothetical protein
VVGVAPYALNRLPGINAPLTKFALMGDMSPEGQLPGLVEITSDCFFQTGQVTVLDNADVAAVFAALPAGDSLLPVPVAQGAQAGGQGVPPNVRVVNTRRAMPIPHEYAAPLLTQFNAGTLSWQWIWENAVADILADPAKDNDYRLFVDYVLASCTLRPGAQAGQPDRNPATAMNHNGLAPPVARDQAIEVARHFLPGLRPPTGIGQQINQIAIAQQQVATRLTQDRERPPKTLARDKPGVYQTVLKICEVPTEADVAPYWRNHANLASAEWVGEMNQVAQFQAKGRVPTLVAPVIPPAMAQDIAGGNITSTSANPGRGLSPFRIVPENYPNADSQLNQNRVYSASLMGTGPVGDQALEMVLDTTKYSIPTTTEEFRGTIESFYVTCMIFCAR